ncbi:DNA-directed rna polymerase [Lasiodiplodia theobromae]|uniref:DNA-directed rna polymerase n=1 Tax=Lasiodiplodia theobromae TaxID=45133 RepID=UPI0015C40290|nr:DNA-directed rna polymerase [Lasiodiplodia theobromae]KAF4541333.1 DNA-directed rna polymerase [Lasiodiplodia theobromae]
MTCRRSTRANFMSCRAKGPSLTGCCDWYAVHCSWCHPKRIDQPFEDHLRTINNNPDEPSSGRTGLHYSRCQNHHRPKFICPRPTCRRSVKPFYDPDRFRYRLDEYGLWEAEPRPEANPLYAQSVRNARLIDRCKKKGETLRRRREELEKRMDRVVPGGHVAVVPHLPLRNDEGWGDLSVEEREEFALLEPEVWRVRVVGTQNGEHLKRCPSCAGEVLRVGSTFRIPGKRDEKGWKEVERMIGEGVDMVARFSYCWTQEAYAKALEELKEVEAERHMERIDE